MYTCQIAASEVPLQSKKFQGGENPSPWKGVIGKANIQINSTPKFKSPLNIYHTVYHPYMHTYIPTHLFACMHAWNRSYMQSKIWIPRTCLPAVILGRKTLFYVILREDFNHLFLKFFSLARAKDFILEITHRVRMSDGHKVEQRCSQRASPRRVCRPYM